MNKLRLIIFLLLCAFLMHSCKKDTVTATAYTSNLYQGYIDEFEFAPDSLTTTVTYNAAAKTKVFQCIGTKAQKQIILSITLQNADNSVGFTAGTYNIDGNLVTAQYNTQVKDQSGNYVFLPQGSVSAGSGSIAITSFDAVNKTITGSFTFYSRQTTYDGSGNVVSITVHDITGGVFTTIPFSFVSN